MIIANPEFFFINLHTLLKYSSLGIEISIIWLSLYLFLPSNLSSFLDREILLRIISWINNLFSFLLRSIFFSCHLWLILTNCFIAKQSKNSLAIIIEGFSLIESKLLFQWILLILIWLFDSVFFCIFINSLLISIKLRLIEFKNGLNFLLILKYHLKVFLYLGLIQ